MKRPDFKNLPYPGLRNIKTAIAIIICLFVYHVIGREDVLLAAFAVIICMQDSVDKSINEGINRALGTFLGGVFGIIFSYLGVSHEHTIVFTLLTGLGVVLLIYLLNIINKKGSIVIACIVYIIIMQDANAFESPIFYSFNRVLDTVIGIVIAVLVNRFLFKPKDENQEINVEQESD